MAESVDKNFAATPADGFSISRWSRLKREAAKERVAEIDYQSVAPLGSEAPAKISISNANRLSEADARNESSAVAQALPPLSSISLTEDFTPFMQAKVPQALKQQALKALFKEPHFNVMDGLDTYIDDYTVFEPIPSEVLATLSSWKTIMNPPQQVVTRGGYAVDTESEEGKAVLAERTKVDTSSPAGSVKADEIETQTPDQPAVENVSAPGLNHPRHGKRVGDFVATAEADVSVPESGDHVDASAPVETTPISKKDA